MPTVLITEPIAESAVEVLKQKGFHVQFEYEKRNSDHAPEDVTAVINRLHPISDEWMAQYPNLKIIAYHGVGYDGIDTEAAKARGICVAITPGQSIGRCRTYHDADHGSFETTGCCGIGL